MVEHTLTTYRDIFLAWKKGTGRTGMLVICQKFQLNKTKPNNLTVPLKSRLKLVSSYSTLYPHPLSVNEPKAVAGLFKFQKQPCSGGYSQQIKRRPREVALPQLSEDRAGREVLLPTEAYLFSRHGAVSAGQSG